MIANTKLSKAAKEIIKAEIPMENALRYFRQHLVYEALRRSRGHIGKAAKLLQTHRNTFSYKPKWMN